MKTIALSRGLVAIVDDEDFDALSAFKWSALQSKPGRFYACRLVDRQMLLMHRVLLDAPDGVGVDHRNSNSLDNRRENLRLADQTMNNGNRRKLKPTASIYKGVSFDARRGRWVAYIWFRNKRSWLGQHETEEAAARAYDRAAVELFGDFARLNFPPGQ